MHLAHLDVMHAHEIPAVVQVLFKVTVLEDTTATESDVSRSTPCEHLHAELSMYSLDTQTPE